MFTINDNCVGCTMCVQACPVEAIEANGSYQYQIDQDKCIGCGVCVDTCDSKAIEEK